jgi:hypothetical protein
MRSPLGRVVRGLHFHVGYESLVELLEALSADEPRLERLSFPVMGLTASHVRLLCSGNVTRNVTELELRDNPLGSDGIAELARACPPNLRRLGLSTTGAGGPGLKSLFSRDEVVTLRQLDLSLNPLTPNLARAMSRSTSLAGLRSLDLSRCRIGIRELHHLTRAKFWENLVELNLRWNPIPPAGVEKLLDAPVPPDLTALILSTPQIGSESRKALQKKYGDRVVFSGEG